MNQRLPVPKTGALPGCATPRETKQIFKLTSRITQTCWRGRLDLQFDRPHQTGRIKEAKTTSPATSSTKELVRYPAFATPRYISNADYRASTIQFKLNRVRRSQLPHHQDTKTPRITKREVNDRSSERRRPEEEPFLVDLGALGVLVVKAVDVLGGSWRSWCLGGGSC